jgi:hypothetical protein
MIVPVIYTDQFKTIHGELLSDGNSMTLILEGYHFVGRCLDDFRPENLASLPTGRFKLDQWDTLDDCTLSFELPLQLIKLGAEVSTGIRVTLKLDAPNDRIDRTAVLVELLLTNKRLGTFNCFEGVMEGIIQALPSEYKIKCCYGCAYSDYNYAGQQFFGDMFCFRDSKREYLQARSKEQFSELMDRSDTVQETHLCPEFKVRPPNTGYRG